MKRGRDGALVVVVVVAGVRECEEEMTKGCGPVLGGIGC